MWVGGGAAVRREVAVSIGFGGVVLGAALALVVALAVATPLGAGLLVADAAVAAGASVASAVGLGVVDGVSLCGALRVRGARLTLEREHERADAQDRCGRRDRAGLPRLARRSAPGVAKRLDGA